MPGSPKWSLSIRFPHQNPVYASPLPHSRYMRRPSHSSRFYHPNNTGPEEWRTAVVIPIHKKGDRHNPDNCTGISLLNTGYNIYSKIIAKRLTVIAEALLVEEQNGFRKGRSCMDCIFATSQLIEKHREFNIPTYIAFVD